MRIQGNKGRLVVYKSVSMYCLGHLRVLILTAATILLGMVPALARNLPGLIDSHLAISLSSPDANAQSTSTIRVRWGPRPGVTRYRLQLATDRGFADIVFDRAVTGTEYEITDLTPGTYFWRMAPLTNRLGEFSAAAAIEVSANASTQTETSTR
ncbi:MAG: hypothetical protein ACMG6H_08355, partial [Acidobacteriota bacterium]